MKTRYQILRLFLFFSVLTAAHYTRAQTRDTTTVIRDTVNVGDVSPAGIALLAKPDSLNRVRSTRILAGAISLTNNGISFVPTFNLGKPAVMFDLLLGKGRFTFEPQLWFSLEGKPWTFLFWGRYRLIDTQKFRLRVGGHTAFSFRTLPVVLNGDPREVIETRRSLVGELAPHYFLTKHLSVGMYYLYARGFDLDAARNGHFLGVNTSLTDIKLSDALFLRVTPQLYYLKLDERDGVYFTASATLTKRNFPLALSSIINKTIRTTILGSQDFIWNATLTYSFSRRYVKE